MSGTHTRARARARTRTRTRTHTDTDTRTHTHTHIYIYIVTIVPGPHQRCPENSRGAPAHQSSRADRPYLWLINPPAQCSMHTDEGWEISPWDSKLTFSLFHSRQQCVTDQHHHKHRTDSPAPGHDWEHLCKQEHHHYSRVLIKSTLLGLKLSSPCRVILPPCNNIYV